MSMRPGVRLGVDVGTVRVGVAVSDPSGVLASPHATLTRTWPADATAEDDDIAKIVSLAREREALEVVVGLPRSLSGGEGPAAQAARKFGLGDVPLICARELDIEGGTPLCIRVMIHLYTERSRGELHHVYLEGARNLRDDLPA